MPEFSTTFGILTQHPCLPGHFPARPVVPAVLLLQSVADALRSHFDNRSPTRVSAAKFLRPVLPGQMLTLQLDIDPGSSKAGFRCSFEGRVVAQGVMRYDVPGADG